MKADAWVNSSALLGRMNFALGLAAGKVRGVTVDSGQLAQGTQDPQQALTALEDLLLAGDVSKQTHDTISKQLDDPTITQRKLDDNKRPPNVAAIAGLILGSPEFQRR
jgi:signal recognition particle GTPase